jgi:hypothetical protein
MAYRVSFLVDRDFSVTSSVQRFAKNSHFPDEYKIVSYQTPCYNFLSSSKDSNCIARNETKRASHNHNHTKYQANERK